MNVNVTYIYIYETTWAHTYQCENLVSTPIQYVSQSFNFQSKHISLHHGIFFLSLCFFQTAFCCCTFRCKQTQKLGRGDVYTFRTRLQDKPRYHESAALHIFSFTHTAGHKHAVLRGMSTRDCLCSSASSREQAPHRQTHIPIYIQTYLWVHWTVSEQLHVTSLQLSTHCSDYGPDMHATWDMHDTHISNAITNAAR
jgi:hypothetical protein